MPKFNFKKQKQPILVVDFWYDLTDGGHISPKKILKDTEQIKIIENAIALLKSYEEQAGGASVIESM